MTGDLFDAAPCGYIEVGRDGTVLSANAKFLELVARRREDVVGAVTFASLLAVGDRIYHETHFMPLLQMHREVHEIAFELVRPDSSRVPVLVSANLRGDGVDAVARTIVFEARDRRSYERELLAAKNAAEDAEAHARRITQTLQQTFVPPTPPKIPGLDISGVYRPAGDGSEVGGDFYDVFQIRTGEWMVVLGDVSGKGVEAATVTAFIRHAARGLAVTSAEPSELLRRLNAALIRESHDRFCTVVVMRLVAGGDGWLVTMSLGGHPQPVRRAAPGVVTSVGVAGSLIGVLDAPSFVDDHWELLEGDSILLFTDGVTEARRDGVEYGEERLHTLVAHASTGSEAITSAVMSDVMSFQGDNAKDDIAIVALTASARFAG